MASQPWVHQLRSAADWTITFSLRSQITVTDRVPASFSAHHPRPVRRLDHGRQSAKRERISSLMAFELTNCLMRIKISFAYFRYCYRMAFYPCFRSITDRTGVPFRHGLCARTARRRGLLAGLYSMPSQTWFHRLRSAADPDVAQGLRSRITA